MSMTAAGIIGLITGIASLIGSGVSTGKKIGDANALTRWEAKQKELENARQKKEIAQYNKDAKKSAIARAIGSQNVMMPRKKLFEPTLDAPDINPVDVGGIIQGVSSGIGQTTAGLSSEFDIGNKKFGSDGTVPTYNQRQNKIKWGY